MGAAAVASGDRRHWFGQSGGVDGGKGEALRRSGQRQNCGLSGRAGESRSREDVRGERLTPGHGAGVSRPSDLLPGRGRRAEPPREPCRDFPIKEPAVLALQNPVVLLRPDDEPRGNLLALERGPELERVVHWHPKIAL